MIFDVNAWVGHWPFRKLRENSADGLLKRMDYLGIKCAAVSSIDSILYRNVQPANESLAQELEPHRERLFPIATINPAYVKWEDDLNEAHLQLRVRGVRLIPQYHGYDLDDPEAIRAAAACAERGLPVLLAQRIEDPRQRHHLDLGRVLSLNKAAALLQTVPELTLIITNARGLATSDLVRNPDLHTRRWYVDLSLAEVHYQLHRSVSEMSDLARMIEQVGPDHLLFGTHLPFSYGASALVKLETLPVTEAERDKISYRTSAELFRIPHHHTTAS